MNKINVQSLYKSYGQHAILQGVSLSANKGDVIVLMGSSGSGKSTLLRCLNLLALPDSGSIQVDEQILQFHAQQSTQFSQQIIKQWRLKMGMVFQQFNLWSHMTVLQNLIEAPVQVLKQNKKAAMEQAYLLLNKVGLTDKANAYPHQLSGGQQQRVAIARALMMKPEIMLFDEPTSALDPEMVGEVLTVMQELAAEGMTMLIATHELGFAKRVASHGVFLENGVITEQGETENLFSQPQTERFKKFLQAMQH